jgi:hypothetical protein
MERNIGGIVVSIRRKREICFLKGGSSTECYDMWNAGFHSPRIYQKQTWRLVLPIIPEKKTLSSIKLVDVVAESTAKHDGQQHEPWWRRTSAISSRMIQRREETCLHAGRSFQHSKDSSVDSS